MTEPSAVRPPIQATDWAVDILTKAHVAATRFNPDARIRVTALDGNVQAVLTDTAEPGDSEYALGEVTILVQEGLEGLLDVEEPHDRLVLRPAGSTPNPH